VGAPAAARSCARHSAPGRDGLVRRVGWCKTGEVEEEGSPVETRLVFYSAGKRVESRPVQGDSPTLKRLKTPPSGGVVHLPLGAMRWQQKMAGRGGQPWIIEAPTDVGAYLELRNR
jgi:hypothetical protein